MAWLVQRGSVYFALKHDGLTIHIPRTLYDPKLVARSFVKHLHRFRNRLETSLWPLSLPIGTIQEGPWE